MIYILSKAIWVFLSPLNFFIILILIGLLFKILKFNFFSKLFYIFSIFFFIIVGVFPTGKLILSNLEKEYPAFNLINEDIDGILILGGPTSEYLTIQHNQVSINESGERLTESIKIINNFETSKIIFSGKQHSIAANKFYEEMNVNIDRIIFESKSKNTYENFIFSKKIANPKKNEKWLLITSSYHMKRSIAVAEKINWKFIPYPVDFRTGKEKIKFLPSINKILINFNLFDLASHEIVGLISYYVLGRTNKIY
tara:strand:- start:5244 stop:6005 length:762 start_codon:yes stop_codon:yes gene_type:complete